MIQRARILLLTVFASLLALTAHAEISDIDNAEVLRLQAAGVQVIDVRTAGEWQASGILPGSHLITLFDEQGRSDTPAWLEKVKGVVKPEQPVIVVCRSGNRSKVAAQLLTQQGGYGKVYNVRQGVRGWIAEQRPLAPAASAVAACPAGTRC